MGFKSYAVFLRHLPFAMTSDSVLKVRFETAGSFYHCITNPSVTRQIKGGFTCESDESTTRNALVPLLASVVVTVIDLPFPSSRSCITLSPTTAIVHTR